VKERRIYLIRHGKADHRSTRRAHTPRGPTADPPLDQTGREQALALTRRLRLMPPPAGIYCSTLTRARETIQPYLDSTGASATFLEDLAEWHAGDWEPKEFEELLGEHPEMPERVLLQNPVSTLAPNSEPIGVFQKRVIDAVEGALADHQDGDIWIVCHGGVINAYIAHHLGIGFDMFFWPAHASVNVVLAGHHGIRALHALGDVHHLAGDAELLTA
jgi:broad specificity phosphatase PhoE